MSQSHLLILSAWANLLTIIKLLDYKLDKSKVTHIEGSTDCYKSEIAFIAAYIERLVIEYTKEIECLDLSFRVFSLRLDDISEAVDKAIEKKHGDDSQQYIGFPPGIMC